MVNVFGESVGNGPGNIQMGKKVVTTVGHYYAEIQQSYVRGFTPYRLHTYADDTFVTPICTYDWRVYVLNDVTSLDVTNRHIATDTIRSELVYFVEGDDGSGVALQGD